MPIATLLMHLCDIHEEDFNGSPEMVRELRAEREHEIGQVVVSFPSVVCKLLAWPGQLAL